MSFFKKKNKIPPEKDFLLSIAENQNKFGSLGLLPVTKIEASLVNTSSLAFLGDAVYSLLVRERLSIRTDLIADDLHKAAVSLVNARSQAESAHKILPKLSEKELDVFKRGRNMHTAHKAKSSTETQYHTSTGLETLFGYLYLAGEFERIYELFEQGVE